MTWSLRRAAGYGTVAAAAFWIARETYRRWRSIDFQGRIVLITGGSRGLGLCIARELASRGARVVVCSRQRDELEATEIEWGTRGQPILTCCCDVTDRAAVEAMVREVEQAWGPIEVVINNAGVIQVGPAETMGQADYEEAVATHLYGPLFVNQAVLPSMTRRGRGWIVNISSIGGRIAVPHLLPYSASKFALVGYSLGLRSELAKDGISVTTVCPGLMRTGSPRNAWFKGQHRKEHAWFKVSDSLPLISLDANRAARRIVEACRRGEALVVVGAMAKVAATVNAFCPGLTSDVLGLVNRSLPGSDGSDGGGNSRRRGYESESAWSEAGWTHLTHRAAARNRQNLRGR